MSHFLRDRATPLKTCCATLGSCFLSLDCKSHLAGFLLLICRLCLLFTVAELQLLLACVHQRLLVISWAVVIGVLYSCLFWIHHALPFLKSEISPAAAVRNRLETIRAALTDFAAALIHHQEFSTKL